MSSTIRVPLLASVAILALLMISCGSGSSPQPEADTSGSGAETPTSAGGSVFPLTVSVSDGQAVTLTRAPQRIVSLSPGHTEILFAIGAGGQVAGTDRFSDYPEEAKTLPKVEYSNTNVESLVALQPDLVIAAGRQRNLTPVFEQAGLTVLHVEEPGSVAGVVERVRLLGRVTGQEAGAEAVASRIEERISAVTDKVASVSAGPRVYHEIDPKPFAAAPNSFVGDLYTLLKAQNVVPKGESAYPQIGVEAVIEANPEVIVIGHRLPAGAPDEVRRRPGWNVVSAVKSGRIYVVEDNLVSRPGPRVVEGLEQVARALYPDRFP
jgi:iron complex transport system substrate-binding protein